MVVVLHFISSPFLSFPLLILLTNLSHFILITIPRLMDSQLFFSEQIGKLLQFHPHQYSPPPHIIVSCGYLSPNPHRDNNDNA